MKNQALLNQTIATNEKVVLTYKDTNAKDYTVELTSSPKIQLSEVKEELTAQVSYDPSTTTNGTVTATIKTNKEVNKVEGWNLSEDKKTLTKVFSTNAKEIVHLVSLDNMTKEVEVKVENIKEKENSEPKKEDTTTAQGTLPQTGVSITIVLAIGFIVLFSIIMYKKYSGYKDVK